MIGHSGEEITARCGQGIAPLRYKTRVRQPVQNTVRSGDASGQPDKNTVGSHNGTPWEYAFYADVMFPSLSTFNAAIEVVSHQTEQLEIQGIYKHNES